MIDLSEFNLKYICKTTKEVFAAKMAPDRKLVVIENGERKTYTTWEARKRFVASRTNRKLKVKLAHTRPLLTPRIKIGTRRRFEEYLNESDEKLVSGLY